MGQMKASPRIDTASFSSYADPRDHDGLMRVGHVGEGRASGVDSRLRCDYVGYRTEKFPQSMQG